MSLVLAGDFVDDDEVNDFYDRVTGAWTAYTPSWASTVNPAIGNGTIGGRYIRVGSSTSKTIHFYLSITMGSTTTYGSNNGWVIGLPVNGAFSNTTPAPSFSAFALDSSASTRYALACFLDNANRVLLSANAAAVTVGATSPFTWATGDILRISGTYELA